MKELIRSWCWRSSLSVFSLLFHSAMAQTLNLVPNGSFETYTQCPSASSQIYFAPPWTGPTTGSSDYFNACSNVMNVPDYGGIGIPYPTYLLAKTGVAYAGIFCYQLNNFREYIQVELTETLNSGTCYYVEFFSTNMQLAKYKTNNIAACISASMLPTNLIYPGNIPNITQHITNYGNPVLQDTVKWEKISGIYEATGNEKFITIGNFKNDSNTDTVNIYPKGSYAYSNLSTYAYIFVDAVSVYSINPNGPLPWSYRDTTIKKGDSVYIGNKMGGLNFKPKWYTQNGAYIKTNAGITVSPTITTKYYVQYTLCGVQRTDTVKVSVPLDNDVAIQEWRMLNEELKAYPVPAQDQLELRIDNAGLFKDFKRISLLNNLGLLIREEEILFKENVAMINTQDLPDGVYFLQLRGDNIGTVSKRFVIAR